MQTGVPSTNASQSTLFIKEIMSPILLICCNLS